MKKTILILITCLIASNISSQKSRETFKSGKEAVGLAQAATELENLDVWYDPSYRVIPYPMGDVPATSGVCTDVIIRVYRQVGIDLQQEVHEDMLANFDKYPQNWGLKQPDSNIDHRRVPNLMKFFERNGKKLPVTNNIKDYELGDIVCWDLGGGILHIGIIAKENVGKKYLLHNLGRGQRIEECLFDWKIIGHYRYYGKGYKYN